MSLYGLPAGTCTAQLVVSEAEAYVAFSDERKPVGPNGEQRVARRVHTTDGGQSWTDVSWRRTILSRLLHPAYPNWPPEATISIAAGSGGLTIRHRDECVLFEPGGESLWESTFRGKAWSVQKLRLMDYEGSDRAMRIPNISLSLPTSVRPPPDQTLKPTV
jgi:hypothetical protein